MVRLDLPRQISQHEREMLGCITILVNTLYRLEEEELQDITILLLNKSLAELPLDLHLWFFRHETNFLFKMRVTTYPSIANAIKLEQLTFERALELNYDEDKLLEELT